MEYKIEVINEDEKSKIFDFVEEFFAKDEPLCKSMNTNSFPNNSEFFLQGIKQKCCFKAVNEKNEIIGVILSSICSEEYEQVKLNDSDEKVAKIIYLMNRVAEESKVFEKYPIYLDGKVICVHRDYGGKGIAGELLKRSKQFMLQNNIRAMIRVCTSDFSARAMKKLGMEEVHTLFYNQFKDENGNTVFKPEQPHVACRTMVMELP